MISFMCITMAFFFLTYIVIERLTYGMQKDSIEQDMEYLWSQYSITLKDIHWKN